MTFLLNFVLLSPACLPKQRKKQSHTSDILRCKLNPNELVSRELVYLGSQHIRDEGAAAVAAALRHPQSKIRQINLDSCHITCAGAIALANALKDNVILEELILYDNSIGDDGASALADALGEHPSALRVLSIPRNRIGTRGGAALGKMIATNTSLQTIYLMGQSGKGAGMGDEGAYAWADGIAKNRGKFWFVNLNGNGITERGKSALRNARVENKHVVFPVDPYPRSRSA